MLRWLWSIMMLTMLWALPAHAEQNFLQPEQAFHLTISKQADGQVRLNWDISQGYYLYRQQMKVEADPVGGALQVKWPAGTLKTDETYGESEVYHDHVAVSVTAPDAQALIIGWQGCADAGLCYPPQTRRVNLADVAVTPSASPDVAAASVSRTASGALGEDQALADRLSRINPGWMLLVFFGLGLLMTFTPCVLPMVPILSSLIAGSGASPKRGFILSPAFVLPMALTYAGVGAAAALAGTNLQAVLQNPWVLGSFGLVFVVLALAMFGFYELQLPAVRGQWTLVDFYADWRVSCDVIERVVFADPRVQQALANIQLLRPDVTANNADDQALMRTHQILGPPTMLLVGPNDKERRAERIIGELSADEFLARLARAKQGT